MRKKRKKTDAKPKAKKMEVDEEESEEEEEGKTVNGAAKADAEEDDDDGDEEDDEEEEDDSDEEEEEEAPAKAGEKRKKEVKTTPPAKKAKVENGDAEGHTIFMGGFEDEDAAKKWLKKSGVSFVAVRHTGKACFADLGTEEDVQTAVNASDDQHRVEKARPRGKPADNNNSRGGGRGGGAAGGRDFGNNDAQTLFVKNLADGVDVKDLQGVFPDSKEIRMPRKPDGAHKGFAFVEFASSSEVSAALEEKQGSELNGNSLYLDKMGGGGGRGGRGGDRGGRGGR